ncbi:MAG: ubiquinol-cytochrome c reductase iron-sulfur subunit [Bacteroidota bacterium]
MKRKEFLSVLGLGAAAIACGSCLDGCKPLDNIPSAPTNVDFTLNLADPANNALKNNGGYQYNNGIIIARTGSGTYVAVSSACTHAGASVIFDVANNRFYCPSHGSAFRTDGSVLNGPAGSPLARYNTSLTGNSLRVYS